MRKISDFIFVVTSMLLASSLLAGAASAQWSQARSENFIFVGDYTERGAEVVVAELEEYRAVIFEILGLEQQAERIPIPIYGVRSPDALQRATGNSFAAGIYTTSREGPVFGLSLDGGFVQSSPARATAYHEFAHHLVATYTDQVYPLWYNEGLADYLSTFEVTRRGKIKLGQPSQSRVWVLENRGWMSMDALVGSIRRYPFGNNESGATRASAANFYAQSWLAAHYINSEPGMSDKFGAYLEGLNSETVSDGGFEQSFGMTPSEFGNELRAYLRRNRFLTRSGTLDATSRNPTISVRKLSRAETDFHQGELTRRFYRNEEGQALAESHYQKSETAGGPIADISAARALLAAQAEDFDTAFAQIGKAIKADPQNSRLYQIAGQVYLEAYLEDGRDIARIDEARVYLRRALDLDEDNVAAHYFYAATYAAADDLPTERAYMAAIEASRYYRSSNFTDSNLKLAEVLMRSRAAPFARNILEKARVWSQNARTRSLAKEELVVLDDMLAGRRPIYPSPGGDRSN